MKYTIRFLFVISALLLSACGGGHSARGGYYLDDGPGHPPSNSRLDKVPDAKPKVEPLKTGAMKPYTVLGKTYTPMTSLRPYKARGIASWYGTRYDGEKTASGERYDMYAMTAAHPILPIPSYARVTNLDNGKSVIVRINDRGPFLENRIIDLSYAAAYKLGIVQKGSGRVEVESIIPGEELPPPPTVTTIPPMPASAASTPISAPVTTLAPAVPAIAAMPASTPSTPTSASATTSNDAEMPAATDNAPEVVEMEREPQGVFLQLGAFGSQDNAERYAEQLRSQADWLANAVQVTKDNGLYRVHAGPFADPTEAKQVADKLNQTLGIQAVVVTR